MDMYPRYKNKIEHLNHRLNALFAGEMPPRSLCCANRLKQRKKIKLIAF